MLRRSIPALVLLPLLSTAACGNTPSPTSTSDSITVVLRTATGQTVGTVTLTPAPAATVAAFPTSPEPIGLTTNVAARGVDISVVITDLTPGSHGFVIHSAGRCGGPDFGLSGPVLNPYGRAHGFRALDGPEAGDLPDVSVGTDLRGTLSFVTDLVTLTPGQPNSLNGANGTSLVVDSGTDDQITPPAGQAGLPVACGVISADTVTPTVAPSAPPPTPRPTATARATHRS